VRRLQHLELGLRPGGDRLDLGVEAKACPGALGFLPQQMAELAAVADLVVAGIEAGMERRQRIEPGSIARQPAASRS
jgi:hypothetical protein